MSKSRYQIARILVSIADAPGRGFFSVTKIEDRVPVGLYLVVWHHNTDQMHCTCPNYARSAHIDDKHGQAVRAWLADGEPAGQLYDATPQSRRPVKPKREPYTDHVEPDDDIPF